MEVEKRDNTTVGSAWSVLVTSYCFIILTCLHFVSEFLLWATAFMDKTLTEMFSVLWFFSPGLGESFWSLNSFAFCYLDHVQCIWYCQFCLLYWMNSNQYNISFFQYSLETIKESSHEGHTGWGQTGLFFSLIFCWHPGPVLRRKNSQLMSLHGEDLLSPHLVW